MALFVILVLGYTASWLTFGLLTRAFRSEAMKSHIISVDAQRGVDVHALHRSVRVNTIVSMLFTFACAFAFGNFLIYSGEVSLWRSLFEVVLVIILYDFGYYAIHRYPFHQWKMLRAVHAVHHKSKHPHAVDSMLLHPAETCIGLGAFFASIALVGGVSVPSFAVLFLTYTTLNVVNHAGINFPRFPLRTLGWLAVKHDKHHSTKRQGNYAFLTTIPDTLFGTAE